jgi:hypothetical protein
MKFLQPGMCFDCRAGARGVMRHGADAEVSPRSVALLVLYLVLASSVMGKSTSMSNTCARVVTGRNYVSRTMRSTWLNDLTLSPLRQSTVITSTVENRGTEL